MARSKTSAAWLREHVTDPYVQRARAEGYRSRAAYKLLDLDQRERLFRPGMLVVDLGAAPGSWSQVAVAKVGGTGRVVALDLLEMDPLPGVTFLRGDFREEAVESALAQALGGQAADLVLSDMAPNMSGVRAVDQSRSEHLSELALEFALAQLKPGGALLVKTFHSAGFNAFITRCKQSFERVAVKKPPASRDRSSEAYLLARGLRAPASGG